MRQKLATFVVGCSVVLDIAARTGLLLLVIAVILNSPCQTGASELTLCAEMGGSQGSENFVLAKCGFRTSLPSEAGRERYSTSN
jgi:hypothetical protein